MQLWDTAGQERFQSLCTSFYRGSDCCLLVFDLSDIQSYQNLEAWRLSFHHTIGEDNQVPIVLVGNKSDKPRAIEKERVVNEWLQTDKAAEYMEASAMRLEGVTDIF